MSASYGNYISTGLSNGDLSGFEPGHIGSYATSSVYDQDRFHPYIRHRSRNCYESYYASGFYPETYNNLHMNSEIGNYLSRTGYHTVAGPQLISNQQLHRIENQPTNSQSAFIPSSIQNLCAFNTNTGPSQQLQSSTVGKDRSHPFYSRKRVEQAEGMTRTRDKYRVVYTEKQRRGLEKEYNANKFITTEIRSRISKELGLSARQIKIWFQNRRAKERRDSRKSKHTEQSENSSADDDNDTNEYSSTNLGNTSTFLTSCKFTGSKYIPEERQQQCRFSNQSGILGTHAIDTTHTNACLFESRGQQGVRPAVSPSEWRMSTGSSFLPTVDVSPLTGNVNFDFELRL